MDSVAFIHVIKTILLPPSLLFLWLCFAVVLLPRFYRVGMTLLVLLIVVFYMFAAPFSAIRLLGMLESQNSTLTPEQIKSHNGPGAIVILGGGRLREASEYGEDIVNSHTLERLRYGAKLKRLRNLPLIVSGGKMLKTDKPEALLMKRALQEDFHVAVEYVETVSRTTWENAFQTRKILEELGIDHVFLVTQGWHMPRATLAFHAAGIKVTPAPTAHWHNTPTPGVRAFLPSIRAMKASFLFSHELLGRWWYEMKTWFVDPLPPPSQAGSPEPQPQSDEQPGTASGKLDAGEAQDAPAAN